MSIKIPSLSAFGVAAVVVSAISLAASPSEKEFAIAECNVNAREAANNLRTVKGPAVSPEYADIEKIRQACVQEATLKFQ